MIGGDIASRKSRHLFDMRTRPRWQVTMERYRVKANPQAPLPNLGGIALGSES